MIYRNIYRIIPEKWSALFGILDGIRTRAKPVKGAGANRYTTRTKFWWDRWDSNP